MPYNLPHSECGDDEEWYCNVLNEYCARIPFKSVRLGDAAYGYDGRRLGSEYRPCFVKRAELEAAGVDVGALLSARARAASLIVQRRLEAPQTKKGRAMQARAKRKAA